MYNNDYTTSSAGKPGEHNYYQNLYNMFGGYNPLVDKHFRSLRSLGFRTGWVLLGAFLMQNVAGMVIAYTPLSELYMGDAFYFHGIGAIAQIFYTFLPFFVFYILSKPAEKMRMKIFDLPKSKELYVLAVCAGLMFCMLGNTATSFLSVIFSIFGIEFNSGLEDMTAPTTAIGFIMQVINFAVVPALCEEFAFRSVLLQPLRKYGDWFAIIATSFAFAVLHGNMVQIPFAFIAGVALSYFCIKTKSIWTSVTIHFINNLISVVFTAYFEKNPEGSAFPYYLLTSAIVFIGAIAMVVFKFNCNIKVKKDATGMDKNKMLKRAAYICTPTMVLAIFNAVSTSLQLTKISSALGLMALLAACIALITVLIKWINAVRKDTRIKPGKMYTVSLVFAVLMGVLSIFSVFGIAA